MVSRLSRTAPLLSALLSCAAALRLRSTSAASSLGRHVKPPLPQVQTGANTPTNRLFHPPTPPTSSGSSVSALDRREGANRRSPPLRSHWQEKSSESFGRLLSARCARFFQGSGGRRGARKANRGPCNLMCSPCLGTSESTR